MIHSLVYKPTQAAVFTYDSGKNTITMDQNRFKSLIKKGINVPPGLRENYGNKETIEITDAANFYKLFRDHYVPRDMGSSLANFEWKTVTPKSNSDTNTLEKKTGRLFQKP